MKTKIIVLCLVIFTFIQVTGCTKSELESVTNTTIDEQRIDIYISKDFIESTDKPFATITEKEMLKEISKILKESDKIPGILDVGAPDYVMDIYNLDKGIETIYLWVGEDGIKGMYMNKDNTETGYSISVDNMQRINQIITNVKN